MTGPLLPHGPCQVRDTVCFSLVVVQHPDDKRYALVNEIADRGFWLPGGGVDRQEMFPEAAVREVAEEAGCSINCTGVLRLERSLVRDHARMRVIYHARPRDASLPLKTMPDSESDGARWVDLQELLELGRGRDPKNDPLVRTVKLRGREPLDWFSYMDRGGAVAPLASFVCTRSGPGVPDSRGDGPPPERGIYPTHCYAFVMVTDGQGRVLTRAHGGDGYGALPGGGLADTQTFNTAARQYARSVGATVTGILGARHHLIVTHNKAVMWVVYAAQLEPSTAHTQTGFVWAAKEALAEDLRAFLDAPLLPPHWLADSESAPVQM